ncbi:hypothetical protein B0H14DRAFT_2565759 [Mycena olivaceomarginata]|nr:hypothetical protein B0H14DRAFT_2565759 [Mycena olivaceomarginata]
MRALVFNHPTPPFLAPVPRAEIIVSMSLFRQITNYPGIYLSFACRGIRNVVRNCFPPDCGTVDDGWSTEDSIIKDTWNTIKSEEGTPILDNGWIRCAFLLPYLPNNDQVSVNSVCVVEDYRHRVYTDDSSSAGWLAQACHIFNSLDIKSNLENYAVGPNQKFTSRLSLSLPIDGFRNERPGMFSNSRLPGVLVSRPPSARKSLDIAIQLGYPLFQISHQQDDLLPHLQEIETDDYSNLDRISGGEDRESSSGDFEGALDAEIASDFDGEMNTGLPVVPDMEMLNSRRI